MAFPCKSMARAGLDPRESVGLWRNMDASGKGQPPEFLSTHPSHGTRIQNLTRHMSRAMLLHEKAMARGLRPAVENPALSESWA
jgi:predicted Zn-dependent protease